MSEKAVLQEIRRRAKLHSDLETQLMNSGPAKAEMIIHQQERIQEYYTHDVNELLEALDDAIYQLETLEPLLNIPEQGYVRNNFRRAIRTLKGE